MAQHIYLQPHLTVRELEVHYHTARDPIERSRWHFLWLLSHGFTATAIAMITGYSAYWIGQIARRYNHEGPDGVRDRRHRPKVGTPLLSQDREQQLRNALAGPAPGGELWCGRTVADWMGEHLRRQIPRQTGWRWLRRLGGKWRMTTSRTSKRRESSNSATVVILSGRQRYSRGGLTAFTASMARLFAGLPSAFSFVSYVVVGYASQRGARR